MGNFSVPLGTKREGKKMAKKKDIKDKVKGKKEDKKKEDKKKVDKVFDERNKDKKQPNLLDVPASKLGECAEKYIELVEKKKDIVSDIGIAEEVLLARMIEEKRFTFVVQGVTIKVDHTDAKDKIKMSKTKDD